MTRPSAGFSKDSETVLSGLLRAGDVLSVALSAGIAYALRAGNLELPGTYISGTVLGMLLTANYMHFARVYSLSSLRRQAVEVAKVVAAWVGVFATLVVVSILTDTSELFSRNWLYLWFSFSLGGFLLLRAFAALQIDRGLKVGRLALKVAIIGHGELARQVDRQLRQLGERNLRVVGFYDPEEREKETERGVEHGKAHPRDHARARRGLDQRSHLPRRLHSLPAAQGDDVGRGRLVPRRVRAAALRLGSGAEELRGSLPGPDLLPDIPASLPVDSARHQARQP